MQYSQGTLGRIFALRLETGDRLPDAIESFAVEHEIQGALVIYIGGASGDSRIVVGPEDRSDDVIIPTIHTLVGHHEVLAVGTLFPGASGAPTLHMHAAVGRGGTAAVGCTRTGVDVWLVGEVILLEILGTGGRRVVENAGFELLRFREEPPLPPRD